MYVHIREKKKEKKVALQYHLYALNYNNLVEMCMLLILVAKNPPSPQEEGAWEEKVGIHYPFFLTIYQGEIHIYVGMYVYKYV